MSGKFDRKLHKRNAAGSEHNHFSLETELSREKQKARVLKNTSWWKKRIANGICHYCQGKFSPSDLTMDHIIPLSRGGKSERINIVAACKECNNKKKYFLPVEWEEYLRKIQGITPR